MSLTERKGEEYPSAQLARSHRGKSAVEHLQKRTSVAVVGAHQFEVANGEFVKADETFFFDARDACDVVGVVVLRLVEIGQDGSGCSDSCVKMVDAEAVLRFLTSKCF